MEKDKQALIWKAVDEIDNNPELLAYVSPNRYIKLDKNNHLLTDENGNYITYHKFNGTYHENYRLIKTLKFGHRPTKEETDEVMFYSVAKLLGKGDARKGIENFLGQFEGINSCEEKGYIID